MGNCMPCCRKAKKSKVDSEALPRQVIDLQNLATDADATLNDLGISPTTSSSVTGCESRGNGSPVQEPTDDSSTSAPRVKAVTVEVPLSGSNLQTVCSHVAGSRIHLCKEPVDVDDVEYLSRIWDISPPIPRRRPAGSMRLNGPHPIDAFRFRHPKHSPKPPSRKDSLGGGWIINGFKFLPHPADEWDCPVPPYGQELLGDVREQNRPNASETVVNIDASTVTRRTLRNRKSGKGYRRLTMYRPCSQCQPGEELCHKSVLNVKYLKRLRRRKPQTHRPLSQMLNEPIPTVRFQELSSKRASQDATTIWCEKNSDSDSGHHDESDDETPPPCDECPPPVRNWNKEAERFIHEAYGHLIEEIKPQPPRDALTSLPKHLALRVMSFNQPQDLAQLGQTSNYWRVFILGDID